MKYEKATVTIIEVSEEDIIATSGCATTAYKFEDDCDHGNHVGFYSNCPNNGHQNHAGQ